MAATAPSTITAAPKGGTTPTPKPASTSKAKAAKPERKQKAAPTFKDLFVSGLASEIRSAADELSKGGDLRAIARRLNKLSDRARSASKAVER